jgi:hypothetical protein
VKPRNRYSKHEVQKIGETAMAHGFWRAQVANFMTHQTTPGYDMLADPGKGRHAVKVSVKARSFFLKPSKDEINISYRDDDDFEFIAVNRVNEDATVRTWIVPRAALDAVFPLKNGTRWAHIGKVAKYLARFENNFALEAKDLAQ